MPYRTGPLRASAPPPRRWPLRWLLVACAAAVAVPVALRVGRVRRKRAWELGEGARAVARAHGGRLASGEQVSVVQGEGDRAVVVRLPGRLVRRGTDVVRVPEVVPARDAIALMPDGAWAIDARGNFFDASSAATVAQCTHRPCVAQHIPGHGRVVQITADGRARLEDGLVARRRDASSVEWVDVERRGVIELGLGELRSDGTVAFPHPDADPPSRDRESVLGTATVGVPDPVGFASSLRSPLTCVKGRQGHVRCGLAFWRSEICGHIDDDCPSTWVDTWPVRLSPETRASGVAVGGLGVCLVGLDHRLSCGDLDGGQDSRSGEREVGLSRVEGLADITEVALAHGARCVRHASGEVRCWGSSLQHGGVQRREAPVVMRGLDAVERLVSVGSYVCALQRGSVTCWGGPSSSTTINPDPPWGPRALPETSSVTEMVTNERGICVSHHDGTVHCWNGDPFATPSRVPDETMPASPHSLALVDGLLFILDGQSRAWVASPFGSMFRFAPIAALDGYERIITEFAMVCALRRGDVVCPRAAEATGVNERVTEQERRSVREEILRTLPRVATGSGEFDLSLTLRDHRPDDPIDGIDESLRAAVGGDLRARAWGMQDCVLSTQGRVACRWASFVIEPGAPDYGRTDGDDTGRLVPGLSDAVEIVVSRDGLACARRASGGVVCWGRNVNGVLTADESAHEPRYFRLEALMARAR